MNNQGDHIISLRKMGYFWKRKEAEKIFCQDDQQ